MVLILDPASLLEGRVKSYLVEIGILAANKRKFIKSIHAHMPRSTEAVSPKQRKIQAQAKGRR